MESLNETVQGQGAHTKETSPFSTIWNCNCPLPGTQPCKPCPYCKRRESFEWRWDTSNDSTVVLNNNNRDVLFNPGFSVGTASVRGDKVLRQGWHHYWEIEMSSDVYGTDMMIGIATAALNLTSHTHSFVSLLGLDSNSWGLSYTGSKHHDGKISHYIKNFGQHTVVGVHLDLWSGTLEYYINRKPMGPAFKNLPRVELYPLISSTAARSSMNLLFSRSYPPSLQLHTMLAIGKSTLLPDNVSLFKILPDDIVPPGLLLWMKNNFWWITSVQRAPKTEKTEKKPESSQKRSRKPKPIPETTRVTRSMTARRLNPIFAPIAQKSVTRSTPCVKEALENESSGSVSEDEPEISKRRRFFKRK